VWNFTPTFHSDTYAAIDPRSTPSTAYAGKVVLITGANKGLGRAFAIAYAEAGASVIIIGSRSGAADVTAAALDAAQKAGRSRPSIHEVKIDVCDPASIDKAAAAVKEKAGRLDILIKYVECSPPWMSNELTSSKQRWIPQRATSPFGSRRPRVSSHHGRQLQRGVPSDPSAAPTDARGGRQDCGVADVGRSLGRHEWHGALQHLEACPVSLRTVLGRRVRRE